jgi:hypothetical protein
MQGQTAAEDIETILGRFQAWTGSREPKGAKDGVREISYEEALESSRCRWRKYGEPSPASPADNGLRAEPGVVPINPPELPTGPEAESTESDEPEAAVLPDGILQDAEDFPQTVSRVRKVPRRKQHFHSILAQSVASGALGAGVGESLVRSWVGEERQVSMSLRVAASEQALIKVRAAEAGVSASAYLRQCALEVEILRAQVQQFLAVSSRGRLAELRDAPRTASAGEKEGWLSRLKRRIWRKQSTQLSLKA